MIFELDPDECPFLPGKTLREVGALSTKYFQGSMVDLEPRDERERVLLALLIRHISLGFWIIGSVIRNKLQSLF